MAATRVRVVIEYRNGDGNFLLKRFHPAGFVPCKGEHDLAAIDAAFLVARDHHMHTEPKLREVLDSVRKPSHD